MHLHRLLLPALLGLLAIFLMNISMACASFPADSLPSADSPRITRSLITVSVPILMYHHVGRNNGYTVSVSMQEFTAQMDWLKQNGYTSVSIDQIAAALRGESTLPPRPVALTFDDGWAHVYTNAVPVMQERGFRGTFFIVANYSNARSSVFLSWDQIKALRSAGHWIGSHSLSHRNLNSVDAATLRREVADSKAEIEKHLGGSVTVFAYPYGATSPRVMQAAQEAGYVAAVTVGPSIQQRSDQVYRLTRINIYGGMTLERFQALVTGKHISPPTAPRAPTRPRQTTDCHESAHGLTCE